MKLQHPFSRKRRPFFTTGETLTEQNHQKECDMNYIIANYQRTGTATHIKEQQGQYGFVSCRDFQEAMFQVKKAEKMFSELPSSVRANFHNNPDEFLEFVQDPNNAESLSEMGLTQGKKPAPKTDKPPEAKKEPEKAPETSK